MLIWGLLVPPSARYSLNSAQTSQRTTFTLQLLALYMGAVECRH